MSDQLRRFASCQICGRETNYRSLSSAKPICNRSNNCSISAPDETTGWKAGSSVSFYDPCKESPAAPSQAFLPRGYSETKNSTYTVSEFNKKSKGRQDRFISSSPLQKKRKCLDLLKNVVVIELAKKHFILGLSVARSNDLMYALKQRVPQRQMLIQEFFK